MRTAHSETSDDYSILSSLDDLSISTISRRSSAATISSRAQASTSSMDDGFEHIPLGRSSQRSSLTLSSASSAPLPRIAEQVVYGPSDGPKPTKSAARRARQRLLQAESSGAEQVKNNAAMGPKATVPAIAAVKREPRLVQRQTTKVEHEIPQIVLPPPSSEGKIRKSRRGGKKNRLRLDKAAVRDALDIEAEPLFPLKLVHSGVLEVSDVDDDTHSEDGASQLLEELDEDEEDEVEGMSVLGGDEGSYLGTPRSTNMRLRIEGSVMSSEDAKTSIDR